MQAITNGVESIAVSHESADPNSNPRKFELNDNKSKTLSDTEWQLAEPKSTKKDQYFDSAADFLDRMQTQTQVSPSHEVFADSDALIPPVLSKSNGLETIFQRMGETKIQGGEIEARGPNNGLISPLSEIDLTVQSPSSLTLLGQTASFSDFIRQSFFDKTSGVIQSSFSTSVMISEVAVHMLNDSNNTQLFSRVMPMGVIANDYLSYMPSASIEHLKLHHDIKNTTLASPISLDLDMEFSRTTNLTSAALAQKVMNEIVVVNYQVNTYSAQDVKETAKAAQSSIPVAAEIAKRYLLITPDSAGSTMWYRDYKLDEQGAASMQERLIESEYAQQNNVSKLYINGELVWDRNEEHQDD